MTVNNADIAVVGLGDMGSRVALALLKQGHKVVVWNRSRAKAEPIESAGAMFASSVADAARLSPLMLVCVTNHQASSAILQTQEVSQALHGKTLVEWTSMLPREAQGMANWAVERNIAFLAGNPLCYSEDIINDQGFVAYSGAQSVYKSHEDVLAHLGGKVIYLGEGIEEAAVLGVAHYYYMLGVILSFINSAAIFDSFGLSMKKYVDAAAQFHPIIGRELTEIGRKIARRSHEGGYPLELYDFAHNRFLSQQEATAIDNAFFKLIDDYFDRGIQVGYGQKDLSVLFELLRKNEN